MNGDPKKKKKDESPFLLSMMRKRVNLIGKSLRTIIKLIAALFFFPPSRWLAREVTKDTKRVNRRRRNKHMIFFYGDLKRQQIIFWTFPHVPKKKIKKIRRDHVTISEPGFGHKGAERRRRRPCAILQSSTKCVSRAINCSQV